MKESLKRLKELVTGRTASSVEILPDGTIRPASPTPATAPLETDPAGVPAPAANPTKLAPRTFGAAFVGTELQWLNLCAGRLG